MYLFIDTYFYSALYVTEIFFFVFLLIISTELYAQDTGRVQQNGFRSCPMFEMGVQSYFGAFKELDKTLSSIGLNRNASSTYLNLGLGYAFRYNNMTLSTVGRYGINIIKFNQHTLDWNILRLSWDFKAGENGFLTPIVGYGVLYIPIGIKSLGNKQSSISSLAGQPNSISVNAGWGYLNFGIALSSYKIQKIKVALSATYSIGINKSNWRNGEINISDIPLSGMNAISLSFLFSRI